MRLLQKLLVLMLLALCLSVRVHAVSACRMPGLWPRHSGRSFSVSACSLTLLLNRSITRCRRYRNFYLSFMAVKRQNSANHLVAASLILAGGLSADNVADGIRTVRPYAVDVSSGVESAPGVKDPVLIEKFVLAVNHADNQLRVE